MNNLKKSRKLSLKSQACLLSNLFPKSQAPALKSQAVVNDCVKYFFG